jgi:hypothetical protein
MLTYIQKEGIMEYMPDDYVLHIAVNGVGNDRVAREVRAWADGQCRERGLDKELQRLLAEKEERYRQSFHNKSHSVAEEWAAKPFSEKLRILRSIRKDAGLTITELSKLSGVSIPHISNLELGKKSTIGIETLGKIASSCGFFLRVEIIDARRSVFYGIYTS